jgi:serine/threonine protein kinase
LKLERYEIGEVIGEGGFGKTYAATRRDTGEQVVVKELLLRGLHDWKPVEHFEREAKVLAALHHPGVPRFIESFEDQDEGESPRFYIVSERIVGETLGQRIEAGYRWSGPTAHELCRALLEILRYLHELLPPVIHRDIKPDNIVLRESGEPVLVDFGAVRDLALPAATGGATVLGTPGYMAPEQALGRADARSDLYGLGATLAHAFTHRHPQDLLDASMQIDTGALAALPHGVRELLLALTRADPTARPESATMALEILEGREPDTAIAVLPLVGPATLPEPRPLAVLPPGEHRPAPAGGRPPTPLVRAELAGRPAKPEQVRKYILPPVFGLVALTATLPLIGGASALLMPLAILFVLALPFAILVRSRARSRRLYSTGVEVTGRVTAANTVQTGSFIDYEYEVDGHRYEGYAFTRDALAIARLERQAPVRVFYDPKAPNKSIGLVSAGLSDDEDPSAEAS